MKKLEIGDNLASLLGWLLFFVAVVIVLILMQDSDIREKQFTIDMASKGYVECSKNNELPYWAPAKDCFAN